MARKGKNLKSVLSRFKMTKRGKVMRRVSQQGHFKAKESGKERKQKRILVEVRKNPTIRKALSRYVHASKHTR